MIPFEAPTFVGLDLAASMEASNRPPRMFMNLGDGTVSMGCASTTGTGVGERTVLVYGLASNCRFWDLVAPFLARDLTLTNLLSRSRRF